MLVLNVKLLSGVAFQCDQIPEDMILKVGYLQNMFPLLLAAAGPQGVAEHYTMGPHLGVFWVQILLRSFRRQNLVDRDGPFLHLLHCFNFLALIVSRLFFGSGFLAKGESRHSHLWA